VGDMCNDTIRKITPQGHVFTLAVTGRKAHREIDRVASARFSMPTGVAVDEAGNVIVADRMNHCIRRMAFDAVTPPLLSLLP
jgi:hypothetical protein